MASEKQIAANRRNASNSTGPKTKTGKKRASLNAFRHGLAAKGLRTIDAERLEQVARRIAGNSNDAAVLEFARSAAMAESDLAHVRQVRADLFALDSSFPSLAAPQYSGSAMEYEWAANALRRLVPELRSTYRYEKKAAARRDSAIRRMTEHIVG